MENTMKQNGEMLNTMIVIATNAHNGQFDKGGYPYILHPMTVMNIYRTNYGITNASVEALCMCIGHDLFEDTSVTAHDLRSAGVSEAVIQGIFKLTKMPGQTHEEYVKQVISGGIDVIRVKKCDIEHNSDITRLKGVREKDIARMEKYNRTFLQLTVAENAIIDSLNSGM